MDGPAPTIAFFSFYLDRQGVPVDVDTDVYFSSKKDCAFCVCVCVLLLFESESRDATDFAAMLSFRQFVTNKRLQMVW
jgi:hypothetical protein